MKKNLIIILACITLTVVMAGFIGCGGGETSGGAGGNEASVTASKGVCKRPIANRPQDVKDEIVKEMSAELRKQHTDQKFKIEPEAVDNFVVLYVEGGIYGTDELKDFADKLNDFGEHGCVKRVVFVPNGSIAANTYRDTGFEWGACPYPSYPCPNGSCDCRKDNNANSSSNSSNSTNSNANSNSSNSGVNSNTSP
ncbi:MAG: hypothetical protein PSX80_01525 [bacterium]|nr:hypothetical protein [bacterium]